MNQCDLTAQGSWTVILSHASKEDLNREGSDTSPRNTIRINTIQRIVGAALKVDREVMDLEEAKEERNGRPGGRTYDRQAEDEFHAVLFSEPKWAPVSNLELAERVREAAVAYNSAIGAAWEKGISVTTGLLDEKSCIFVEKITVEVEL